ncbi:MAG: peptidase [Chloracidobacterium sp.]|uniref:Peptidase n=1 Tax=Chloracidobacterium validum TaxID=2821543 RepID=A0ABX8BCD7_9BACT|nr:peptidase [Chloracidobacterium validum]QUW04599.1 peptidase [Chloracidobacterium validum]
MTFCLGIKTVAGLVAVADTRITSGTECRTSRKLTVHRAAAAPVFVMTSGLRSARDKVVTYFDEWLRSETVIHRRLYELVNAYGEQVRRVFREDHAMLERDGLRFDLFSIIGGRLPDDGEHRLFLVYPQANWVEIGESSPYAIIGNAFYGKPILDRVLDYGCSLDAALKAALLAFDCTLTSASDVSYPLDVAVLPAGGAEFVEHRFMEGDVTGYSLWWRTNLRRLIADAPGNWLASFDLEF